MSEHVSPLRTYFVVWGALMGLMVLTAVLSRVDIAAPWNTVIALAIAAVKALLVLLFFMHLKYESYKLSAVVLFAGLFWLSLLFGLSLVDYLTRGAGGVAGH